MGNDNIFTLLNNPGDVEFPAVTQNNFNDNDTSMDY